MKVKLNSLRADILDLEKEVRDLFDNGDYGSRDISLRDRGEVWAHMMLSVRHLEDARMRLGKALQWLDDGVSIFDKEPEEAPVEEDATILKKENKKLKEEVTRLRSCASYRAGEIEVLKAEAYRNLTDDEIAARLLGKMDAYGHTVDPEEE